MSLRLKKVKMKDVSRTLQKNLSLHQQPHIQSVQNYLKNIHQYLFG
ncbi:unnamed protein product [Trichobilharzia regenti]|nr:unnamed protein product [Trichobilharzia regenti]